MNSVTWSKRYPGQHDSICVCDECESYRKNEVAAIQRQVTRGEWDGNVVVTGIDKQAQYNRKMENEAPDGYHWNGSQYLAGNNVECSHIERLSWGM